MSIVKPYTFTAGTKARANEVNQDFDTLYQQVNTNITNIEQANYDITNLQKNKADLAGNNEQTFEVANPESDYHAVNKTYLNSSIINSKEIITGLVISEDTSGTYNILVSKGSCYDSELEYILNVKDIVGKKYTPGLSADTLYYVYVTQKKTEPSTLDITIDPHSPTPDIAASGDYYYRQIGYFQTDENKKIETISNNSTTAKDGQRQFFNVNKNEEGEKGIIETSITYLDDWLPNDDLTYLCWFVCSDKSKSGAATKLKTDLMSYHTVIKLDGDSGRSSAQANLVIAPVGSGRWAQKSGDADITLVGYMKA